MTGTNWIAIAGILGTLVGVGLGSFVTWKIQKLQIKHSDETLFQKERLEAYANFFYSGTKLINDLKNDKFNGDEFLLFVTNYLRLELLASDKVRPYVERIHRKVMDIHKKDYQNQTFDDDMKELSNASSKFLEEVRKELRVR